MMVAVILIILAFIMFYAFKSIKGGHIKSVLIMLLVVSILSTIFICINKPIMHKPFSFSVIEYLIKFNDDGSMTTIKQTTHTNYREINE